MYCIATIHILVRIIFPAQKCRPEMASLSQQFNSGIWLDVIKPINALRTTSYSSKIFRNL